MHFAGNSAEGLGSMREHPCGCLSIFENTPKKLMHLSPKSCHNLLSDSEKGTVVA